MHELLVVGVSAVTTFLWWMAGWTSTDWVIKWRKRDRD